MFINTIAPYGHASPHLSNKLPPTLHRPTLILNRLLTFLVVFSTTILKRSFSYLVSPVPNRQIDRYGVDILLTITKNTYTNHIVW